MHRLRATWPVAAVAVAAVAAAGCSSGGGAPVPAGHSTAPARPGASVTTLPTGTQLGQFLAHTKLPAGWSHASGAGGGETDSGGFPGPASGPESTQYVCPTVDSGAQAAEFIQWWSQSYANMILTYPSEPQDLPQVSLVVGVFKPGYAQKTLAQVSALAGRCRSFRDTFMSGAHATVATTALPHLGDQNLYLTSADYTSNGKITDQVLLARMGNDIVGVDTNTGDAGHVRPATVQGFAGWLLGLLPHLPAGSAPASQSPGAPPSVPSLGS